MICQNITVRRGESYVAAARESLADLCRNDVRGMAAAEV